MEISDIYTVEVDFPDRGADESARRPSWLEDARVANPLTGNERYGDIRADWLPEFGHFGCVVEAEDETTGFALGRYGRPAASVVEDYLADRLVGEPVHAVEKIYDMAVKLCRPFGGSGIESYAISSIDLALWDLRGKLLDLPVYELVGGPAREELRCYATGNDTDWHMECGFEATKLACPYGPADGRDGLRKTVELIAETRDTVGTDVELMLDCWMAFDEEYAVRLANAVREYDLKWIEDPLTPDRLDAQASLRDRLPWQTLATGEHWYMPDRFAEAANRRLADVFQPDIRWVGGLTGLRRVVDIAEAAGISVVPHGGGNTPYGQHACYAFPNVPVVEFFVGTAPGVPLSAGVPYPGVPAPENGTLVPSEDPGFGVDPDALSLERPYEG